MVRQEHVFIASAKGPIVALLPFVRNPSTSIRYVNSLGGMLITELDCGLDQWTGLTFELKLHVPDDLHPIKCAELSHMFNNALWLIESRETKGHSMNTTVGVLCLRDLEHMVYMHSCTLHAMGRCMKCSLYNKAVTVTKFNWRHVI